MKIGIPREIKILEGRVALNPQAVKTIVQQGHQVVIEQKAGVLSGYSDNEYLSAGAEVLDSAKAVYDSADLIVKVKEPQTAELKYLRKGQLLFSYLHLAAAPDLTNKLLKSGVTAIAFETVQKNNQLPLLAPMSDIAGRIAVQIGTHLLHQPQGGRGILLGGVGGVGGIGEARERTDIEKGQVVILGGGIAGTAAAGVAAALGANVLVFDPDSEKRKYLEEMGENVSAAAPSDQSISEAVRQADLLIGAVLIPGGAKAPHLVSAKQVKSMQNGSVILDISVDQGGCIETTRPTTYDNPTYVWEGVIHFGVTNMPGAVPRTATQALSAAILPYVLELCEPNWQTNPVLASGLNVQDGVIILPALM